mgnify:CR=1 FL=1
MKLPTQFKPSCSVGILAIALGACAKEKPAEDKLTAAEARSIAQDGYLFGLPLVYIALQADAQTNVAKPEGGQAPFNQFNHHREFPDAKNNTIVGMNVDTLYSIANVDLAAEPIVLVVPPMEGKRWWLMQIIDASERRAGRTRLSHPRQQRRQLCAGRADFTGTLPAGLEEIRVDTSLSCTGRTDLYRRQVRLRPQSTRFRMVTS